MFVGRSLPILLGALGLTVASPAHAQETQPPGVPVGQAVAADLPESGVNFIIERYIGIIPPDLVIGSIPTQELFEIPWICTQNLWIDNLIVHTTVNSVTVEGRSPGQYPPDGALVVNASIDLSINDPSDPAHVYLEGCLDYVCNLHTVPATILAGLPVTLRITQDANGDDYIDIDFGDLTHNIEAALAGAIYLTGCAVGDIDAFLNDNLGLSVFDLIVGQFVGTIETQITDALADLEITGEEALLALWIEGSTDILETQLDYQIYPSAVDHNEEGLRLVLAGATDAPPDPCVAQFALKGSQLTPGPLPAMTGSVPSNNAVYHLGALLADDFANQAMFSLWNGGVMCFVVRDGDVSGFAIDSSIFGLLGGNTEPPLFGKFFELGAAPMVIRTLPENPPIVTFDGAHDIDIHVEALNVQFVPMILDRFTNLVTVAIDVDAGIDVSIAPDGALALDIFLDTENLNARVTYNELDPEANAVVEANFGTLVNAVINLVAGGLLEGMKIALPVLGGSPAGDDDDSSVGDDDDSAAVPGLGAVQLDMEALGLSSNLLDYLGAYILLGDSTGGESSGGCGDCAGGAGCADCGGEGGCGSCADAGGCDIESALADQGCTGAGSGQPADLGCQGCKVGTGVHRIGKNHWRVLVDSDGASVEHPQPHRHRGLNPGAVLVALLPVVALRRRRRLPSVA